jgi:hypothetical protein
MVWSTRRLLSVAVANPAAIAAQPTATGNPACARNK